HEQGQPRRSAVRVPFINEGGAGAGTPERLDVFAVIEKGHVLRAGGLKRRDIAEGSRAVRLIPQPRPAQRRKLVERMRPGAIEKATIGHAAPDRGTPPYFFFFGAA